MKNLLLFSFVVFLPLFMFSQALEVEGEAKITIMNPDPTAQFVVVKQADGTLAVRDVATLTGLPQSPNTGEVIYWDGAAWITLATGTDGQIMTICGGIPTWTTGGACPSCSDGIQNQGETGIDCGGPNCPTCPVYCTATSTAIVDVTNPITGRTWMDRNLGATQVATSSADVAAYGDIYQWGRGTDGHQCRTAATTTVLSSTDQPGHGDFIISPTLPNDWRNPQNDNLWQGVNGVNNPCPTGYRLPTETEWEDEYLSWATQNLAGAFGSVLKLPAGGNRITNDGSFNFPGTLGFYWSSNVTVGGTSANPMYFNSSNADIFTVKRGTAVAVRCIKD